MLDFNRDPFVPGIAWSLGRVTFVGEFFSLSFILAGKFYTAGS